MLQVLLTLTFSGHQRRGGSWRCGIPVRSEQQLDAGLQLVLWPQGRSRLTGLWSGLTSLRKCLHTRYNSFKFGNHPYSLSSIVQDHCKFHVPEPAERISDIIQDKLRDRAARNPLVAPGERKYGITVTWEQCVSGESNKKLSSLFLSKILSNWNFLSCFVADLWWWFHLNIDSEFNLRA